MRISFLIWRRRLLQRRGSWRTGQFGAPCRPLARATRRPRIVRPTVALAAVGSPDSPVNFSRTPPNFPESGLFTGVQPGAPDTVRCTTGQSSVPDRAELWLYSANSFAFLLFFSLFPALRPYMLVHKNQCTKSRNIHFLCFALLSSFSTKELN
jgi:hypothetical protein